MKSFRYLVVALVVLISFSFVYAEEAKQEEDKVTGSVGLGVYNRYIFRGYELSSGSVVIQPSVTVSYKGFSVNYWGNIDTNERQTQSFVPDRPGRKSFNESDLTLSYTFNPIDKLSLTAGYIYYGTKYTDETEELFLSATYDVISKPTLTIYRDISTYPSTYINLSFSHSFEVYKDITLDLAASFGYFKGDDSYWRTYERSTGEYTGKKYSGFHDGKLQAGFTIPITKNLTVQPVVQYWFPLSNKAKRIVDGNPYNPNGHLDDTWVTGINITFSF
ncbi:TorF family putative porin [Thermodesulfovibrio hydrogeniphilus]